MLNWEPTPANIRQQIAQVDFILANQDNPISKIFIETWTIAGLEGLRMVYRLELKAQQRHTGHHAPYF